MVDGTESEKTKVANFEATSSIEQSRKTPHQTVVENFRWQDDKRYASRELDRITTVFRGMVEFETKIADAFDRVVLSKKERGEETQHQQQQLQRDENESENETGAK